MGYKLLINGIYSGYNPLTNLLLASWDIRVLVALSQKTVWSTHRMENCIFTYIDTIKITHLWHPKTHPEKIRLFFPKNIPSLDTETEICWDV